MTPRKMASENLRRRPLLQEYQLHAHLHRSPEQGLEEAVVCLQTQQNTQGGAAASTSRHGTKATPSDHNPGIGQPLPYPDTLGERYEAPGRGTIHDLSNPHSIHACKREHYRPYPQAAFPTPRTLSSTEALSVASTPTTTRTNESSSIPRVPPRTAKTCSTLQLLQSPEDKLTGYLTLTALQRCSTPPPMFFETRLFCRRNTQRAGLPGGVMLSSSPSVARSWW